MDHTYVGKKALPNNPTKSRNLKITLVSPDDLPNIHWWMKVYAVVSVNNGGIALKSRTTGVDFKGKTNPKLRVSSFDCPVEEGGAASDVLVVKLYRKRSVKKDMLVREWEISVKELLHQWERPNKNIDELQEVGRFLKISYSFHDSWQ